MNRKLTLMAVHAHPDDESIGTGGILTKCASQGIRTVLVYGTGGEEGEIQNPQFVPPAPGMSMKEIRAMELEKALKVLRVDSVHALGYRDSGMAGKPANHRPDAFAMADMAQAAGKLVDLIRRHRPQVILTYNERGTYGHPDHIMANRVTTEAYRQAGNPDFVSPRGLDPWRPSKFYHLAIPLSRMRRIYDLMRQAGEEPGFDPEFMGIPDEKITTVIDVREYLAQKMEAVYCHDSQIGPKSFFRRLPEEWKKEAFGFEHFICVNGCGLPGRKEEDLFEGLR